MKSRRVLATIALPLLSILGAALYLQLSKEQLPARLATHWDGSWKPNGFMDFSTFCIWSIGMPLGLGALFSLIAWRARTQAVQGMVLGMVWLLLSTTLLTTFANLGAEAPEAARLPPFAILLFLLLGGIGYGLGCWIAGPAPTLPASELARVESPDPMELGASETVIWTGRTPPIPGWLWIVILPAIFASYILSRELWALAIGAFLLAIVIAFLNYTVTIGPKGIRVAGILGGIPWIHLGLDKIHAVEAGEVRAMSHGGWGLRINMKGETAVLTRSGPALLIHRKDGLVLRISLDHPEEAARVISTLLDRAGR